MNLFTNSKIVILKYKKSSLMIIILLSALIFFWESEITRALRGTIMVWMSKVTVFILKLQKID